jgi:hypothetical protein
MDLFAVHDRLITDYSDYVRSFIQIRDLRSVPVNLRNPRILTGPPSGSPRILGLPCLRWQPMLEADGGC